MRFDIVTIFPHAFDSYLNESILKRAQKKKLIQIKIYNLRDFSKNKYKKVDDKPYGGGAGMILMAEPILRAGQFIKSKVKNKKRKVVVFSAKGKQFNQKMAYDWSKKLNHLILISGRYEGIDERVKQILKAEEISIGPYVLTDGDLPAMAVISAVARLLPGVINCESLKEESFFNLLLEYPHYTRPKVFIFKGKKYSVPKVLLSGNHQKITHCRRAKQHKR